MSKTTDNDSRVCVVSPCFCSYRVLIAYVSLEAPSSAICDSDGFCSVSKDSVPRIAPRPQHKRYIQDAADWIHLVKTANAQA